MNNAELIKALRCGTVKGDGQLNCPSCNYSHGDCCWTMIMLDAADALETADKRIAELEKQAEHTDQVDAVIFAVYSNQKARIAELETQLPKEGKWIRKEVKVYCPRDCWNPSACAIEGTWNEEEGWNLEMQDGFCSVCGEQDDQYYKDKYCPNCGSIMDGEQDV